MAEPPQEFFFALSDYKWTHYLSLAKDSEAHALCERLFSVIKWPKVLAYASNAHTVRPGQRCQFDEGRIGLGGRHMVRIVSFADGSHCVARFSLTPPDEAACGSDWLMLREVDNLKLVADRTSVPVPRVLGHGLAREFGASFILMELLPSNVAVDLNQRRIPEEFKMDYYTAMADAQIHALTFPKIGTPILNPDGTVEIGPIPNLGGPFNTAAEYLRALGSTVKFKMQEEEVQARCGSWGDKVWNGITAFPYMLKELADDLPDRLNYGPFPLIHTDFGDANIVVDNSYKVLGVIDWEYTITAPWLVVAFPLMVRTVPPPMDLPSKYDEQGVPVDEDTRQMHRDRQAYIEAVQAAERKHGIEPRLSQALLDDPVVELAEAIRLYERDSKMGFYDLVVEKFRREVLDE